jgi:hypothetical protein
MTKKSFLLAVLVFTMRGTWAQPGAIDPALIAKPSFHYLTEFSFDKPLNPSTWQTQASGLHVAFASSDDAYFRTEVPTVQIAVKEWEATGWKGERINMLILVWSPDTLAQVRFETDDLKNSNGEIINKSNLSLNMVRYVLSNYPYNAGEVSCGEGPVDKAWLMPDRFESFNRFDLPGQTVRPVWLSVDIPRGTGSGVYKGSVRVFSEKQKATLNFTVKVQDLVLPPPHDWTFRLDLWQNPWVIAEYYHVKPWSSEHMVLLEQHLKLYADAGGKYITTYAVHSPWSDNSYMAEGTMIEWIKRPNGSWKFDYSIFDQYVQLAIKAGIDKAITVYTPLPWGERFRYLDEANGNYIYERWLPESGVYKDNWNSFLTDLKLHLEKKGWLGKTYIGINENAMEQTLAAIKVVKNHSRNWKITYAGDWHPELDSLLDDYSCVYGKEPGLNEVRKRTAGKQTSTFYVCCTPAKPNTFVFSPPVEGRWLGWYTMAHGYDGFLRWAYDAWPADPVRDARHILWPAGDCYMTYPGGASGVHFEKMREGIVDYEKLKILRKKAAASANIMVMNKSRDLEQLLQTMNTEKDFISDNLRAALEKGKKLVNELSELLQNRK